METGRSRQEPAFKARADRSALDLKLTHADRAGGRMPTPKRPASLKDGAARPLRGNAPRAPRRPRRSLLGRALYSLFVLGLWGVIGLAGLVAYHASQLPPIDQLKVPKRPPNIAILGSDGSLLANRGETGGRVVGLKELPPHLPAAFLAIEDKRFYDHWGIDPVGIARADRAQPHLARGRPGRLDADAAAGEEPVPDAGAHRLAQDPGGDPVALAGAHVLEERAARALPQPGLFRRRRLRGRGGGATLLQQVGEERDAAEAAVLAGLVQAPSRLAPNRNPQAAQARAKLVLAAMAEQGRIAPAAEKAALAAPAKVVRPPGAGSANYAADWVMDVLDDFVGTVESDIVVSTTIDPKLQSAGERAVVEELDGKGARFGVEQGALVSLKPDGAVRALVGGRRYEDSQFNRATTALRQPGSAFKPFVYLAAVERGLTPDTVREDAPVQLKGWSPENYSRDYRGPVPLREALALSLNTVAVRLGLEVGPKAVVQAAQRLGIASPLQANPSIALGTSEVTPLELVGAYAAFANGGAGVIPYVIAAGEDDGRKAPLQARRGRARPGDRPERRRHDERHDARHLPHRHGAEGRDPRLGDGRQDRHQPGFPRRLVRRLHGLARHRRVARQRRRLADEAGVRRQPAGRGLEPLHANRARRAGARAAAGRLGPAAPRRRRPRSPAARAGWRARGRRQARPGLDTARARAGKNLLERLFGL